MIKILLTSFLLTMLVNLSCNEPGQQPAAPAPGSFGFDLRFLEKQDSLILLQAENGLEQIIVSPKYQGKIFTSTADGEQGPSFGWVNYKAFGSPPDPHMNGYGGENRLWLGPEGGKFSLFFQAGDPMVFEHWKTPAAFDSESWTVLGKDTLSARLQKDFELANYAGTRLTVRVNRNIRIWSRKQIADRIGVTFDDSVRAVGYETENILINRGTETWTTATGMPCIWILDMFPPSAQTTIVIPYRNDSAGTKPATTDYFGEIPPERLKYANGVLVFKADGRSRGKLGIHPGRVKDRAGSYDAEKKILTLIVFDIDNQALYLNQEWNTIKAPFSGDAMNAYNDGPLAGGGQLGPFYELESVSPAAFLQPGSSLTHHHSVFHFTGNEAGLNAIAEKSLGFSLDDIKKALP